MYRYLLASTVISSGTCAGSYIVTYGCNGINTILTVSVGDILAVTCDPIGSVVARIDPDPRCVPDLYDPIDS